MSELAVFNVFPIQHVTGRFEDEYFQTIDCTGTDSFANIELFVERLHYVLLFLFSSL